MHQLGELPIVIYIYILECDHVLYYITFHNHNMVSEVVSV